MHILDSDGHTIAYLVNKVIFSAGTGLAVGLVLGNCVYGSNGKLAGKFFDDTFRTQEGLITGKLKDGPPPFVDLELNQTIIRKIFEHADTNPCGWIPALDQWAPVNFIEFIKAGLVAEEV